MLRGEVGEGRGVKIAVLKPDSGGTAEYFIEFAVVEVPSVIWRPVTEAPEFGYIQIRQFTSRTPEELRTALNELDSQGVTAWILDLRSNSGGLLQESVEVASEFLDGGVVFYEQRRDGETETVASPGGEGLDKTLVVLVNGGTASAAELVAGAIRDQGHGILIDSERRQGFCPVDLPSVRWFVGAHHVCRMVYPGSTPIAGSGLEPNITTVPAEEARCGTGRSGALPRDDRCSGRLAMA